MIDNHAIDCGLCVRTSRAIARLTSARTCGETRSMGPGDSIQFLRRAGGEKRVRLLLERNAKEYSLIRMNG